MGFGAQKSASVKLHTRAKSLTASVNDQQRMRTHLCSDV